MIKDIKTVNIGIKITIILLIIFLFTMINFLSFAENVIDAETVVIVEEKQNSYMKVNFYIFDVNQSDKGDFLGTAELKDGKLKVDVTDSNLREILESPYETMAGEVKNGTAYDWIVIYQPGTLEHLRAIVVECWSYGYVAEIINSEKGDSY